MYILLYFFSLLDSNKRNKYDNKNINITKSGISNKTNELSNND